MKTWLKWGLVGLVIGIISSIFSVSPVLRFLNFFSIFLLPFVSTAFISRKIYLFIFSGFSIFFYPVILFILFSLFGWVYSKNKFVFTILLIIYALLGILGFLAMGGS